jgi:two-component system, chemotaxis family, protein-glutamate methylesterase/glutaminase
MPPAFTAMLAEQIGRLADGACREAQDGEPITTGRIYVAPGDHHLEVVGAPERGARVRLSRAASENFCRPSVDPMLRSLAAA